MHIRSFVETVAIREIATKRAEIETACFAHQESAALLRLQTLAGIVCVKRAVGAALGFHGHVPRPCEKDIIIGHDVYGAPIILEMPGTAQENFPSLCISLSHTKDHACGCAVLELKESHA
jgi:phosphopantetheinyl transferase (holo-ACP synthase)